MRGDYLRLARRDKVNLGLPSDGTLYFWAQVQAFAGPCFSFGVRFFDTILLPNQDAMKIQQAGSNQDTTTDVIPHCLEQCG